MPGNDKATALLVLGMHRSGTSLLSGLMAEAGVSLGEHLMPAAPDNPKGFWENQPIVDFNESLLNLFGQTWASWEPLPEHWLEDERLEGYRETLASILDSEFGNSDTICIKDPRLCRLLPFWQPLLSERGMRVIGLVVSRPVGKVAASLQARDSMGPAQARALWMRYSLDNLAGAQELEQLRTSYEALLAAPEEFLSALQKQLGSSLALENMEFADSSLRHHHLEPAAADTWATLLHEHLSGRLEKLPEHFPELVAPPVSQAAELEVELAKQSLGDTSLDAEAARSTREQALFAQAQEAKQYAGSLWEELKSGRAYIQAMQEELAERQDYAQSLEQSLRTNIEERDQYIESLKQEVSARDSELERGRAFAESLQQLIQARESDIKAKDEFIASLQEHVSRKELQLQEFAEDIEKREQYTASLQEHISIKEAELAESRARVAQLEHQFRHLIRAGKLLRGKK
jgi:hypothetical protein